MTLQHVMAGFAMPEPFFSVSLDETLSSFLSGLTDPALPLMEMQVGPIWNLSLGQRKSIFVGCMVSQTSADSYDYLS